ncbi:hypothetical protein [Anatilimnocola floriformis]|uniref:hypothetical protein n=1 Tax=Anatilimnocola floriformis TaxID=2948575 RepID=UPI0020C47DA3|nr:hypothetical protein [Anatilimnocola floriformis]
MELHIENIAAHRNGVHGAPFCTVNFQVEGDRMIGIVFEKAAHIAVFHLGKLAEGNITFGENSWRGDQYEAALRSAIALVEEMNGFDGDTYENQ